MQTARKIVPGQYEITTRQGWRFECCRTGSKWTLWEITPRDGSIRVGHFDSLKQAGAYIEGL